MSKFCQIFYKLVESCSFLSNMWWFCQSFDFTRRCTFKYFVEFYHLLMRFRFIFLKIWSNSFHSCQILFILVKSCMNLGENFIRFLISLGVFSISLISFDCWCTLLYCYLLIAVTYIPLQHFGTYIDVCNDDRNYTV